jgi:hypothetical protein
VNLRSVTPSADPTRSIPISAEERSWAIEAALASLKEEERRLARLGFEFPLARCHQQRRFWEFVRALHELPESRRAA